MRKTAEASAGEEIALVRAPGHPMVGYLYMGFARARPLAGPGPAIRILTGGKDPHRQRAGGRRRGAPGMEQQADQAIVMLRRLGHSDITRRRLPSVGHDSCAGEVWKVRDQLLC